MEKVDRLNGYLDLLHIRKKAYYRNAFIGGALFFFGLIATTATVLLTEWNSRSIWLMSIFDVLFILNFLMAWSRFEIVKQNIELLSNL